MRVDKFLKVTRLLKRRTLAQELCDKGCVKLGDRTAKPSSEVKAGDTLTLALGRRIVSVLVTAIPEKPVTKENASDYYKVISSELSSGKGELE